MTEAKFKEKYETRRPRSHPHARSIDVMHQGIGNVRTTVGDGIIYDCGLASIFRLPACFSALSFAFFCKPSIRCLRHCGPLLTTSHTSGENTTTTPDHIAYVHPAPIFLIKASLMNGKGQVRSCSIADGTRTESTYTADTKAAADRQRQRLNCTIGGVQI
jgi:hypothetical protein